MVPKPVAKVLPIGHLSPSQVKKLTEVFRKWYGSAPKRYTRKVRGRYWITFLFLRFTGARIGEILILDDSLDIDFRRCEIRIPAAGEHSSRQAARVIPVPRQVVSSVTAYLSEFSDMRGKVFALDQGNFRREFYKRAEEARIPKVLSHPHILRHTRAIEMLNAGVPLATVQDLLGHALSSTTAIYLRRTGEATREILKDKGLL